ncbi:9497_t:CDS:2, partial [Dentiscutata erythropus]
PVQVRKWQGLKQKLIEALLHVRRLSNGFRPKYPELEVVLSLWVRELRQSLKVVTRAMIQLKAKALSHHSDINMEDHQRIENIETYFSQEKEDSIEEYEDDYYE